MKKYNLWLDDQRPPPNPNWVWAKSPRDFQKTIERDGPPFLVSLDHDLNKGHYAGNYEDKQTGLEAAEWLKANVPSWCPVWHVHTRNPDRGASMRAILEDYSRPLISVAPDQAIQIGLHVKRADVVLAITTNPIYA